MTLQLNLPPAIEADLLAQALKQGVSLEAYVSRILQERSTVQPNPMARKKSLVELFEPLRGLDIDLSRNPSTGRSVDL